MRQIRYLFRPSPAFSLDFYAAKHDLENDPMFTGSHDYIGNGEFIVAMILSGYEAKFDRTPNAVFNGEPSFERPTYC